MSYVPVPEKVFRAVEALKKTGLVSMMHIPSVVAALRENDLDDVADWVNGNRSEYARGLIQGMEPRPQ